MPKSVILKQIFDSIDPDEQFKALFFDILADGETVGSCSLKIGYSEKCLIDGNVGYFVLPQFRGNGYAVSAVKKLCDAAKKFNMDKIFIVCEKDNNESIRVCEKCGGIFDIEFDGFYRFIVKF